MGSKEELLGMVIEVRECIADNKVENGRGTRVMQNVRREQGGRFVFIYNLYIHYYYICEDEQASPILPSPFGFLFGSLHK